MVELIERLAIACGRLPTGTDWELIVVTSGKDSDISTLERIGARAVATIGNYGDDLKSALALATGCYILTMESDLAHSPFIIPELYASRVLGDVIVASRYVAKGYFNGSWVRRFLSFAGNTLFRKVLDFPVRDLTSSFRLYNRRVFENAQLKMREEDVLLEILVTAYASGFKLAEIPFHYNPAHNAPDQFHMAYRQELPAIPGGVVEAAQFDRLRGL